MKLRALISALAALAVVVGITLSAGMPAAALPGDARVAGKATDSVTGAPLPNVCVVNGPVALRCWTITNSLGEYEVIIPGLTGVNFTTNIQFFLAGYTSQSHDVTVTGGSDIALNVALVQTNPGTPPPTTTPPPFVGNPPPPEPAKPTFTVYLPNIVRMLGGRYGWHTPFIIQNVGAVSTNLSVKYYKFSDGSLVATRTATVLPGRSFVGSPNDEGDLPAETQFSVVITSVGSPVVAVVNEHQGGPDRVAEALSYSGLSAGSTKVNLPLVSKLAGGWLTTMIMQNLGAATASVNATFARIDQVAAPVTITRVVQPGRSQFIDPRSESALVNGAEYAVTVTSLEPIGVVANAHNDLAGAPAPMGDSYNGIPNVTNTTSYSPYVPKNFDGVGRSSRVVIQNAGTTAAMPSITLSALIGGLQTPITAPLIEPGASWFFVPTLADAEYAMVVAGGTFAILTTAISPATAMFYTGTSTPANKLYLPNVTRTLSGGAGDPGWTTPILIQSADATAATLRWYRFSDGTLVTTQPLTFATGATTRVDPRLVPGLSDNTQYSVVLESPGNVVAIVTELNLSSGDNAMIYKAFLQP